MKFKKLSAVVMALILVAGTAVAESPAFIENNSAITTSAESTLQSANAVKITLGKKYTLPSKGENKVKKCFKINITKPGTLTVTQKNQKKVVVISAKSGKTVADLTKKKSCSITKTGQYLIWTTYGKNPGSIVFKYKSKSSDGLSEAFKKKVNKHIAKMNTYVNYCIKHKNSTDPAVKAKQIKLSTVFIKSRNELTNMKNKGSKAQRNYIDKKMKPLFEKLRKVD